MAGALSVRSGHLGIPLDILLSIAAQRDLMYAAHHAPGHRRFYALRIAVRPLRSRRIAGIDPVERRREEG
jgi:hypothetical protein